MDLAAARELISREKRLVWYSAISGWIEDLSR